MTWLPLLLALGATVRLTRLISHDPFPPAEKLRAAVLRRAVARSPKTRTGVLYGDNPADWWPYKLLTCPWCVSFWIGLPAAAAAHWAPTAAWFVIPAAALTASHLAGVLANHDTGA